MLKLQLTRKAEAKIHKLASNFSLSFLVLAATLALALHFD